MIGDILDDMKLIKLRQIPIEELIRTKYRLQFEGSQKFIDDSEPVRDIVEKRGGTLLVSSRYPFISRIYQNTVVHGRIYQDNKRIKVITTIENRDFDKWRIQQK